MFHLFNNNDRHLNKKFQRLKKRKAFIIYYFERERERNMRN